MKDITIALTEAEAMQLSLLRLQLASEMYDKLVEKGFGDKGTHNCCIKVMYKPK